MAAGHGHQSLRVLLPCARSYPFQKNGGQSLFSARRRNHPMPNISAYAASKGRRHPLVKTLAGELENRFAWTWNAIAPGALKTRFVDQVLAAAAGKSRRGVFRKKKQWARRAGRRSTCANLAVISRSAQSDASPASSSARNGIRGKTHEFKGDLTATFTPLRRIVPKDRGKTWGDK